MDDPFIFVVIPALDEEASLPRVLEDLAAAMLRAKRPWQVIVVDNGSRDRTPEVAIDAGATLLREQERGYGAACLRALRFIAEARESRGDIDPIVAFLDADYSDYPQDIDRLLEPILRDEADLVLGSRLIQAEARSAVPAASRFGNRLASVVLGLLYGVRFTDLGPFRAIRHSTLERLRMRDRSWGWTVEMQLRACREGVRILEVPVRYRRRHAGRSKISGSLWGGCRAGIKILWVLASAIISNQIETRKPQLWMRS